MKTDRLLIGRTSAHCFWFMSPNSRCRLIRSGDIEFHDYSMRYREGLPLVLDSVNFHIKKGEKVGVVGTMHHVISALTFLLC
jgi:ABC-type transport system involved in cytochrome bd biosynthesis fused ATPase/permease subunit